MTETYWQLLVQAIGYNTEIPRIASDAGIPAGEVRWDRAGKDVWRDVLDVACRTGRLPALHDAVCAQVPQVQRERLTAARDTACGARATVAAGKHWYTARDVYRSRFVGPTQLPLIGREDLSSGLMQVMEGWPVLLVFGGSGTGRSYSWFLVQHVTQSDPRYRAHLVDIERDWGLADCAPTELAQSIGRELAVKKNFSGQANSDSLPRLVGQWLHGQLLDRKKLDCLVIDGVDRPNVLPETKALVRDLIGRVARHRIPSLRLIVTGRRDPADEWDPTTSSLIVSEDIAAIGVAEVEAFFRQTAADLGTRLDDDQVRALVAKLDAHLLEHGPLADLGEQVGQLARVLAP